MSPLPPDIEERLGRLPEPPEALARRREALASFRATGFPTRKQEAWRYTDLKPIASGEWEVLAPPTRDTVPSELGAMLEHARLGDVGIRLVFVDGQFVAELSDQPSALPGLEIGLGASPRSLLDPAVQPAALAELNAALTQQQIRLRFAAGAKLEAAPVHLVFAGSCKPQQTCHPRIEIELGKAAHGTVVQHFLDPANARGWINLVAETQLAEEAGLTVYRLQEHAPAYLHTELTRAEIAAGAHFELKSVDLGGQLVRNDFEIVLMGREAQTTLTGLFVAGDGQHVDNHTRIDHRGRYSRSRESFRGIASEKGRGIFNGKVVVHAGADGSDAQQKSNNLLLAPGAEIDTKPELEIYTDDVKCSHGATVGEIDAEQLFYLRSRGIADNAARSLLTFAFANRVLQELELPALRQRVTERIAGTLPEADHWMELL